MSFHSIKEHLLNKENTNKVVLISYTFAVITSVKLMNYVSKNPFYRLPDLSLLQEERIQREKTLLNAIKMWYSLHICSMSKSNKMLYLLPLDQQYQGHTVLKIWCHGCLEKKITSCFGTINSMTKTYKDILSRQLVEVRGQS